jgi:hypothetical protein
LTLTYNEALSNFAFKFNLRRYVEGRASVIKRCGTHAAAGGLYAIDAAIDRATIQVGGGASILLSDVKVGRCRLTPGCPVLTTLGFSA